MSTNCKIVKVLSLISVVCGIFVVVVGALALAGSEVASVIVGDFGLAAQIMGAIAIIVGLFYMVAGIMGARGANRPSKLGTFIVLAAIIAAINLLDLALIFVGNSGGIFLLPLLFALIAIVAVIYASRAKKEAAGI